MAKFTFTEKAEGRHKIALLPTGIRLSVIKSFGYRIIVQWELEEEPEKYYFHRVGKPAIYEIDHFQGRKRIERLRWYDHGELHCDTGPAVIDVENKSVFFYHRNKNITKDVIEWMQRDHIPLDYKNWTSNHKLRYKLKFS